MNDWRQVLVSPTDTIHRTIQVIDRSALQVALVVDENQRLLGVVTDGDIRRGILRGVSLEEPVAGIMNSAPTVAPVGTSREDIVRMMQRKRLRHIPVVDTHRTVVNVVLMDDLLHIRDRSNWVVLMAGGEGIRLRPLTNERPKPLLRVGAKPILETILTSFVAHGFHQFFISVNYKADMIEEYFGDGSKWGVNIRYLKETEKMGTAGCLNLLPEPPKESFIVMNGDLLTNVNFTQLLEFHHRLDASATLCIREHRMQVPYGVVETDSHRLVALLEKPIERYFINAGIYVLEPSVLDKMSGTSYMDMTVLLQMLLDAGCPVGTFPIHEYWSDIGQLEDFRRAQHEVAVVFEDD